MKFISWNVNGLRACVTKGFADYFRQADADFFCLQETKLQPHQIQPAVPHTCRVAAEQIIVFVIPTDEQGGE